MGPKKAAAAVDAEPEVEKPRFWTAEVNGAVELDLASKEVTGYKAASDFKVDYLKYCELLKLLPHPSLNKPEPPIEELEEGAEPPPPPPPPDRVEIRNHVLDGGTLAAVGLALPLCETITSISFYNAALSPAVLEQLGALLLKCPQVVTLDVSYNPLLNVIEAEDVNAAAGAAFAAFFEEGSPVKTLSLRGNQLGDVGATAIAGALTSLSKCSSVLVLNLFDNGIGDSGTKALADALKLNVTLKSLSLASNKLGRTGGAALIEALGQYELAEAAPAYDEMAAAIADFNKNLAAGAKGKKGKGGDAPKAMAELPLLPPPIPEEDGRLIAKGNRALSFLNLGSNQLDATFAVALAEMLNAHKAELEPSLRAITLCRNPFGKDAPDLFGGESHKVDAKLFAGLDPIVVNL